MTGKLEVLEPAVLGRLRKVKGICFDMDGTLTIPALDFAKMRELTGVPDGKPILETVLQYPEPRRSEAMAVIKQVEKVCA